EKEMCTYSTRLRLHRYLSTSTKSIKKEGIQSTEGEGHWVEKLLHNCFLEKYTLRPSFKQRLFLLAQDKKTRVVDLKKKHETLNSIALKYLDLDLAKTKEADESGVFQEDIDGNRYDGMVQYPYQIVTEYGSKELEVKQEELKDQSGKEDSENVDPSKFSEQADSKTWIHDYGTPNPNIPASEIPCGGCGALLQCQDTGIPGFIPSERFTNMKPWDLRSEICQRCFFLKVHNAALNVNVSPAAYPKILREIEGKRGLVLLLVDLIDFPCSIWPGIADIIGSKRPVILVGNKVDLIPRDSKGYLEHIKTCLRYAAEDMGLDKCRIIHTALISASSGYGVEDLISSVHSLWEYKDDIYIMGCTNVGKSTLFNTFLQSDLCKIQAVDLVQRATVSQWPGTTLNLLKFPIMNRDGWRIHLRNERLKSWKEEEAAEKKLREFHLKETGNSAYASLIGRVGRSYRMADDDEKMAWLNNTQDVFQVNAKTFQLPKLTKPGSWNPDSNDYSRGKWCYDTPGAINENQILDKLLLPELMKMLPKKPLEPRSFFIRLGRTVFVGGIARIDYTGGCNPIRLTFYVSQHVPITVVETKDADEIYEKALGTPVFGIPMGNKERLNQLPPLKARDFELKGISVKYSCNDIVISGAGWVAVTAGKDDICHLKVHTPNGAGIFCRQQSLLPNMIRLKGKRIRESVSYGKHQVARFLQEQALKFLLTAKLKIFQQNILNSAVHSILQQII
ncbi:unnamed protein product, partial [Allacma fusca]